MRIIKLTIEGQAARPVNTDNPFAMEIDTSPQTLINRAGRRVELQPIPQWAEVGAFNTPTAIVEHGFYIPVHDIHGFTFTGQRTKVYHGPTNKEIMVKENPEDIIMMLNDENINSIEDVLHQLELQEQF